MTLTDRELGTVLCSLRLLQRVVPLGRVDADLIDIATDGGELTPLDVDEIDELCQKLNASEG